MKDVHKEAESYLSRLSDETMFRAWKNTSREYATRIVIGALLFGERLEDTLSEGEPKLVYEQDVQRLLMRLMNEVISAFAEAENLSVEEAGDFLGDVDNRDRIFEFNEVIEDFESPETKDSLDELLTKAVKERRERALWADHWTSG